MMRDSVQPLVWFAAGAATCSIASIVFSSLLRKESSTTVASPLQSYISQQIPLADLQELPYPPDAIIPGARDVPTPYGTLRVYEFGPESSKRKVLFLHGISTPSVALANTAEQLAAKGCRVMLVDHFNRGWSGGPSDLPYDDRLYTTQILLALSSSSIAWTGSEVGGGFSIIGYSLGGAVAINFASWFPEMVDDLVLLAPGGLIRDKHRSWQRELLYSTGLIPESLKLRIVKNRLRATPNIQMPQQDPTELKHKSESRDASSAVSAEIPKDAYITTSQGQVDIEGTVNWQLDSHAGFTPAFMSSIRHAPVFGQHERWALVGKRLAEQRRQQAESSTSRSKAQKQGLRSGKVLMILGSKDSIIVANELGPDARATLGEDHVEIIEYEAGHEVAVTHSEKISNAIWEFWNNN